MKELTRKLEYETAHTCRVAVEVEQTFCGSFTPDAQSPTGVETVEQTVNTSFNEDNNFVNSGEGWD